MFDEKYNYAPNMNGVKICRSWKRWNCLFSIFFHLYL